MTTITQLQYDTLKTKLYDFIMSNEDAGLGEIGDARDESNRIAKEWVQEQDIDIELITYKIVSESTGEKISYNSDLEEAKKEFNSCVELYGDCKIYEVVEHWDHEDESFELVDENLILDSEENEVGIL